MDNKVSNGMKFRYRTDEEMKYSGVEWIGKIPQKWIVKRNKNLFKISKNIVGDMSANYKILSLTLKGVIERDLSENAGKIPATFDGYQIIKQDSLLLCLFDMDVTPRISGYVPQVGIVSPAYTNIDKVSNNVNNRFYSYWFLYMDNEKILLSYSKSLRNTLTNENFMGIPIIHLDTCEQEKIAKFLDEKIAEFDSIISKKEALIEKLEEAKKSLISEVVTGKVKVIKTEEGYELIKRKKEEMKDSEVEWLGLVPNNWNTFMFKRIIKSVKNGIWGDEPKQNENDICCIRILNFNRNKMEVNIDDLTLRNIPILKQREYLLKKGDLLIEKSGGGEKNPVGFVARYNHALPAVYANFMAKISLREDKVNSDYIKYLCANIYNKRLHLDAVNQTTGIQNLDTEVYFKRIISLPNINEQEKIAKFLDEKTAEFNSIISKNKVLIRKLKKAKQSLISEAVTGKIEVLD